MRHREGAREILQRGSPGQQTTFDAISDAVSLMDLEGRTLRCNTAMTEFLEKPFSDIIGCTCW